MKVLIACECSGVTREAFRAKGHDAWSCDLKPAEDESRFHLRGDALWYLGNGWDLLIAHPPCTYLAALGERWMTDPRHVGRDKKRQAAWEFFRYFIYAPVKRICIENPRSFCLPQYYRKPDQEIHPWWFGDVTKKPTCLWLKNLPPLIKKPYVLKDLGVGHEAKQKMNAIHWAGGTSEVKSSTRSKTFEGVALAMADQWGSLPNL